MLIGRTIFKRIDEIVERSYLGFLFDIAGDEFFTEAQKRAIEGLGLIIGRRPLIELLYILIRNRPTQGYAKDASLNMLLDEVAARGILPVLSDTHQATLNNAKVAVTQAIESAKEEIKKQLKQQINEANKKHKQETSANRLTNLPEEAAKTTRSKAALIAGITLTGAAVVKIFERAFTTSLTDFVNDSVVDNIGERSLIDSRVTGDTKVYKEVINDGSLCQWCRKFYLKAGKPIIYSLTELAANGSNYGKPKSQWKPTIGATHPRCRCQLHYLTS